MSVPGHIKPGGVLMPGHAPVAFNALANLFPMLAEDRRETFRASLADRQNHPIVLWRGSILDGRNRYRELCELNKPISYVLFEGTPGQALTFVFAENIERRDLDQSQRAQIIVKAARLRLGDNQHTRAKEAAQLCAPSLLDDQQKTEEPVTPALSQNEMAEVAGVSRRLIQHAVVVEDKGALELRDAVVQGKIAGSTAAEIAALPIEQQREIVAAANPKVVKEIAKGNRTEKQKKNRERRLANMATPDATSLWSSSRKVGVFLVDIPREFIAWSAETGAEKSPENHYRTEDFNFLCGLRDKILGMAQPNCVMFMWGWANSLPDQLDLMVEWGFASARRRDENCLLLRGPDGRVLPPDGEGRYRSHLIWAKRTANGAYHRGTGYWFIDCHELLLVGARGDVPVMLEGERELSILDAQIGPHSAKPEAIRALIDRYFPGVPKAELFARVDDVAAYRAAHPDWEPFGNQVLAAPAQAALSLQAAE